MSDKEEEELTELTGESPTADVVVYLDLSIGEYTRAREFLARHDNQISYEFNDTEPTWLRLIGSPTDEQVAAFEEAIS